MNTQKLAAVLAEHYHLHEVTLTPAARGFVAETYIVQAGEQRYFAKHSRTGRYSRHLSAALPALRELHAQGIDHISYPIPTTDGRLLLTVDERPFFLLNSIAGEWTFDYPFAGYVDLLAQVHRAQVQPTPHMEDFSLPFRPSLLAYLDQLWHTTYTHPHDRALQQLMRQDRDWLLTLLAEAEALAARLQPGDHWRLTHGDAPGNVLKTAQGALYLVDWDDLLLAPPERDTWFHLESPDFLPLYRQHFPDYQPDWDAYAFYLYLRYFDDLEGFLDLILQPGSSDAHKADALKGLHKDCNGWLKPLIARVRSGDT
ncbi:MAG: aminoglycoside phosphotransferase family protein [Anaerolineae bacterium]|nr:aminoglycoside phosphotransferase family protein [Anaerolineae bacterium]